MNINLAMFRIFNKKFKRFVIFCCHLNICIYLLGSGLYIVFYNFLPNPLCVLCNKYV